jgi:hypothetical protein
MFPMLLEVDIFESVRCYLSRTSWQALRPQETNIRVPSEGFESSLVIELFFYTVCRTAGSAVLAFLERVLPRYIVYDLFASAHVVPKYELLGHANGIHVGSGRFYAGSFVCWAFTLPFLESVYAKKPFCGDSALSYTRYVRCAGRPIYVALQH